MPDLGERERAASADNPLSALSDQQLWASTYSVILQCLRSKGGVNKDHSKAACELLGPLVLEHERRGIKPPQRPYSA